MTTSPSRPTARTAAARPSPATNPPLDGRDLGSDPTIRLRHALTTALALSAPSLLVIGNALLPELPRDPAAAVAALPAVADRYLAAAMVYALASLFYVPFVLALWRIRTARGAGLRFAGGVTLVVGMVSSALSLTTWGYLLWGSESSGLASDQLVRLMSLLDTSAAALPISFTATTVAVLGMLVLAVGVLRSGVVPTWAVLLWVVGTVLTALAGAGPLALTGLVGAAGSAVCVWTSRR